MDPVMVFVKETGDRILASLRRERAIERARKDAEESRRRSWALARDYRRLWGTTPCSCGRCPRQTACPSAWGAPECAQ